jgi:leucyl aminopeptidase
MDLSIIIKMLDEVTDSHFDLTLQSFQAKSGEVQRWIHPDGTIWLLGLGEDPKLASLYRTFRKFTFELNKFAVEELGLVLFPGIDSVCKQPLGDAVEFILNGVVTGTHTMNVSGESAKQHSLQAVQVMTDTDVVSDVDINVIKSAVKKALIIGSAQQRCMHLINIPSNWKNPLQFADTIQDSAKEFGIHCEVFDEMRLREEHFDALLAVNRGSEHPARFVVLQYDGSSATSGSDIPLIALIGKGVTYDTGGLSMKPSESMVHMKCDMAGAAIVLAVTEVVAQLKLPVRLVTAIPLTDNLVDSRSIKPGDIIGSYAGKTIEVIDTDAEGRLILADAISWIVKNTSPDYMIDLATLTGAAVRTFGPHAAALFTSGSELEHAITHAADHSGERVWPLPLWDVYNDDIKSDIADVKNFSGKPTAGSISAAKFLEYFTENHPNWAHLDVAGTVYGDTEFAKSKNATGYGVRLVTELVTHLAMKSTS